jgi:hypothetical protein
MGLVLNGLNGSWSVGKWEALTAGQFEGYIRRKSRGHQDGLVGCKSLLQPRLRLLQIGACRLRESSF